MVEKKINSNVQVHVSALEDIPSFTDAHNMLKATTAVCNILKFFRFFGLCRSNKWAEIIALQATIETQFQQIEAVMQFNQFFIQRGWVAFESFDVDVMHQAVILAQQNGIDEAETKLIEFFNEEHIRNYLKKFKWQLPTFEMRAHLLELALEDYTAGRYHACIPVVLMMIDGIINDVNPQQKSGESANVTAWDSLAGHPNGLENLYRTVICKSRTKTTNESIVLPHRNGILHGRDLGYANHTVAAKAWNALFAVGDWALALRSETPRKEKYYKKQPKLTETLKSIQKTEMLKRDIDTWKPRQIDQVYIDALHASNCCNPKLPEYSLLKFLEAWSDNNYGEMASKLYYSNGKSINKIAGNLRKYVSNKIIDFQICDIRDTALAATEIDVNVKYKNLNGEIKFNHSTARLINRRVPEGDSEDSWVIVEISLLNLLYGI